MHTEGTTKQQGTDEEMEKNYEERLGLDEVKQTINKFPFLLAQQKRSERSEKA